MAREFARMKLSMWDDDEFRLLSPPAQHLYLVLTIHPKLDYCGVTDWRPGRLAQFAGGWTAEAVEIAAQELSERLYIIVDAESEEVLIRSFIRSDGFMDQPNMAVAMRKAHAAVASAAIRGIIVHELTRLHTDYPELKGWAKVSELLNRPSLNPSDYPSFTPSVNPSSNPSVGVGGKPSAKGSGTPSPTTAPSSLLPTPASQLQKSEDQDLGVKRPETLRAVPATEPASMQQPKPGEEPTCSAHPCGNPTNEPCAGCGKVREHRDRNADREAEKRRREAEAARNACNRCDGHWVTDDEGKPTRRKCDHAVRGHCGRETA